MGRAPFVNLMFGLRDLRWSKQFSNVFSGRPTLLHSILGQNEPFVGGYQIRSIPMIRRKQQSKPILRLGNAKIRGRLVVSHGGRSIDRPATSRLVQLRQKKLSIRMSAFGRRSQPNSRFLQILWNALSKKISRSQPKFGFALSLFGCLSVPDDGLRVVNSTEFLVDEDIA